MREVSVQIAKIDEFVEKLQRENEEREGIILHVNEQIVSEQQRLGEYESSVFAKEKELDGERENREEMLGENVISMISDHLKIGDFCPVCSSRVIQKVYSEKNDLSSVDGEIEKLKNEIRSMRFERDKIFAGIVSLKARVEFEKSQIASNSAEIENLTESKNKFYQKYVDNNDSSAENLCFASKNSR